VAYLSLALRVLIAVVCLVAAIGKLSSPGGRRELGRMLARVGVPRRLVRPVATGIVLTELSVAGLAPWPGTALVGMLLATALLGALTVGVTRAVRAGTSASCRCFGARGSRLGRVHIARNAVLTAVAVAAVVAATAAPDPVLHPAGVALAVCAGTLGALAVIAWEDLAAVLRSRPAMARPSSP
jgi:hypothetical protein